MVRSFSPPNLFYNIATGQQCLIFVINLNLKRYQHKNYSFNRLWVSITDNNFREIANIFFINLAIEMWPPWNDDNVMTIKKLIVLSLQTLILYVKKIVELQTLIMLCKFE